MISFAAITPHPPLLIPNIGKENLEKLKETEQGLEKLKNELLKSEVEVLIIISSYSRMHHDAFSIIFDEEYSTDFKEFGDFNTKMKFKPDVELIEKLKHAAMGKNIPFTLTHSKFLDYAYGVPLYHLAEENKIKIIPLSYAYKDLKSEFEFGKVIKKVIAPLKKRVGVIASGNMSHRSTEASPVGFSVKGKEFNDKFIEIIQTKNTVGLLAIEEKMAQDAEESILLPTAILMGAIDKLNFKSKILSYESPFGVGYLVCNFELA